jgi:hypothetical protein
MDTTSAISQRKSGTICRTARIASVGVSVPFLFLMLLALTNEDPPRGAAIPVLLLLALTLVGCFAAWRWPKAGAIVVALGAGALGVAAYMSSQTFGLGRAGLLTATIYALPFVIVAILFWVCARNVVAEAVG